MKRLWHGVCRYLAPRPLALLGWAGAVLGVGAGALWLGDDFAQRFAAGLAVIAAAGEVTLGFLAYRLGSLKTDTEYDERRVLIARSRYALAVVVGGAVLGAGAYGILNSPKIDDSLKIVSVYLAVFAALKIIHSEHYRLTKLEHEHAVPDRSPAVAWTDTVSSRVVLSAGVLAGAWILLSPLDTMTTAVAALPLGVLAFAFLRSAVKDDVEPPALRVQAGATRPPAGP